MAFTSLKTWLNFEFFGTELYQILSAFVILLLALLLKKIFDHYLVQFAKKITKKTESNYDDLMLEAVKAPVSALIICIGIFYAAFALQFPKEPYNIPEILHNAFKISISVIIIWTLYRLSNLLAEFLKNVFAQTDEDVAKHFAPLISQALKFTIFILGILVLIQNMGYSVSSLIAGLGIGGLAIALAAQETLANLFGTFVMLTDKPFKVGDWVQFADVDGDVETIGFRSTKIRTWSKSLKIVPNKLLTSEIIENWSAMPKRRVKMTIGVTYDSPPEKVLELRDRMEQILVDDPDVDKGYYLVYFTGFGSSQLEIFVYYFTKTTVWKEYLEVRQRVNVKFMRVVEELGLSFAFPSQTLYFGDSLDVIRHDNNQITEKT